MGNMDKMTRRGVVGAGCGRCLLAAVLLWAAAVSPVVAAEFAFVTTTDFVTGSASRVSLDGSFTTLNNVASVHSDAVCRYFDGLVYVVNRQGGDNIQILDPNAGFSTVRQFSVGTGSDPHDVIVVSPTKAYVTRYNATALWIVDPSSGAHTGTIDLSAVADVDGIPEMDQMVQVDDRVFVTVQRLDRNNFFTPVGASFVAVIDVTADTLVDADAATPGVQSVALAAANPFSSIQLDPFTGRLYLSGVGLFGVQDEGVEWIHPETLQTEGVFFAETSAGGDIQDVEIVSPVKGYAIISDAGFNTVLITFNPQTGLKTGTVFAPGGFVLNDIERTPSGGELFLADRTATLPGIRIFDVATDVQLTPVPIDMGLPPFDICFSVPVQTGVPERPPVASFLGPAFPNPFNPSTTIPFTLERGGRVRLEVFDATGRRVRTLVSGVRHAGPQRALWDGRDASGRPAPSGVYFVRFRTGRRSEHRKVVRVR